MLGKQLESIFIQAIEELGGESSSLEIGRAVRQRTGKDYTIGTVYVTLCRMVEKGLLDSQKGESTPPERQYFRVI